MTGRRITTNEPIRIGRTWLFSDGTLLPVVAGGDGEEGPIIVPDDLTDTDAYPDDDLAGLEQSVVDEFDRLLDEGSTDVARMTELAEALERIRGEQERRDQAAAEAAERIQELAARIHPQAAEDTPTDPDEPDEGGDDPGDGDPEAPTAPPSGEAAPEPVAAGGARVARRPVSASGTARRSTRPAVPDAQPRVTITAAADLPGVTNGAEIDLTQVAVSMHDRARSLTNGGARQPVARFTIPQTHRVTEGMSASATLALLDEVADQRRFGNAEGLVAAGWCTPSQNLYDLLALEGATGLLDLPQMGIDRGGVNVPSYIGLDAADGAMWTWSEGQDAAVNVAIASGAVTGGVGTANTTGSHLLNVGDLVDLHTNTAADGPRTVTGITDADTFTYDATGVANIAGPTIGTFTRQKSCFDIPCPTWSDVRLQAYGLCLKHGNLTDRAFPELTRRYVALAMAAHLHRMSAVFIAMLRTSTNTDVVTVTPAGSDNWGEVMSAIEMQEEDYRSQYKISDNVILESVWPVWVREAIRASLAMRSGVDLLSVSDAQITAAFTARNTRPQFLEDYQPFWTGTPRTVWPTSVEALMFPAGGFIVGNGGTIDLGVLRDSRLNATNDFTAAWTEDFRLLAKRGPKGRRIIMTLTTDGVTGCCP